MRGRDVPESILEVAEPPSKRPPSLADAIRRRSHPPALSDYRRRELFDQLAELHDDEKAVRRQHQAHFVLCRAAPSGLISIVLHLSLMIALGIHVLTPVERGAEMISIEVVAVEEEEKTEVETIEELAVDFDAIPEPADIEPIQETLLEDEPELANEDDLVSDPILETFNPIELEMPPEFMDVVVDPMPLADFGDVPSVNVGLANRIDRRRQALANGATPESESAVELALEWLARHQLSDGSWSFNHRAGDHRCQGCLCDNPGSTTAPNGATGMALLPFLGAGRTHLHGEYRMEVAKGLRYLIDQQKQDGSLMDTGGNMYSHGLATLALCEAYALARYQFETEEDGAGQGDEEDVEAADGSDVDPATGFRDINWTKFADKEKANGRQLVGLGVGPRIDTLELGHAAQQGIRFIQTAQHSGGGWRYGPGQPGDTSVVGWQMMALKSGHLSGLQVQPATIRRAVRFLDSVQSNKGSSYGYTSPGAGEANTAIGLLCRMFTGWDRQHAGLAAGVERMEASARVDQGLYYYYYATQVMHHYGGPHWRRWNSWMRDHLVETQDREGSIRGSWSLNGPHDCGRLYCTALATVTLEVYYRYSPIYGHRAVADGRVEED